jgi:hypothetical protein
LAVEGIDIPLGGLRQAALQFVARNALQVQSPRRVQQQPGRVSRNA